MKELFTRVLQGHIALSQAVFPEETAGGRLELLARGPIWQEWLDYGHGTGHGVGQYLCVHEGPVGVSPRSTEGLRAGHILTIEPGYYEAGKFGIRTENVVAVVPVRKARRDRQRGWLGFRPLTLCPIDRTLIEPGLLDPEQIGWMNDYHSRVRRELSPHLEAGVRHWLERATEPLPDRGC
jgi:Xaa-Pro aminopeptidase